MTRSAVRITAGICSLNFCHMVGVVIGWCILCEERLLFTSREMHSRRRRGLCSCCNETRYARWSPMSLNRSEQRVFDYLQRHPDERQYWLGKFQRAAKATGGEKIAIEQLESELWRYYRERSEIVPAFKDAARQEGLHRMSMKNLAELLMRLWVE